jgi:hypothetical protein
VWLRSGVVCQLVGSLRGIGSRWAGFRRASRSRRLDGLLALLFGFFVRHDGEVPSAKLTLNANPVSCNAFSIRCSYGVLSSSWRSLE